MATVKNYFTPENMAHMAESYDPSKHKAPVVASHPKHNHPALGWVNSIEQTEKGLVANADISPNLAQAFEDGLYKNVSASLYQPNDPNNPTFGFYSKHLGILGATPPVVKGLEAVQLAEGGETVQQLFIFAEGPIIQKRLRTKKRPPMRKQPSTRSEITQNRPMPICPLRKKNPSQPTWWAIWRRGSILPRKSQHR